MEQEFFIRYEYDEDSLFGGNATGINLPASYPQFEKQVQQALQAAYPAAQITVVYAITLRTQISGLDATEDQAEEIKRDVQEIAGKVWDSWEWLVKLQGISVDNGLSYITPEAALEKCGMAVIRNMMDDTIAERVLAKNYASEADFIRAYLQFTDIVIG